MRKILAAGCVGALLIGMTAGPGQDGQPPKPQKEHEWLQQVVGEWDSEGDIPAQPGQPAMKTKGSESGRMVGGFWAMLENKGEIMGAPFTGILTLGYDPQGKKYVGTWIDSMSNYLWRYQGSVDASGKVLTLDTEGPSHGEPGKLAKYQESIEIKSKDHKVFTSKVKKDGEWVTFLTVHYRRKK